MKKLAFDEFIGKEIKIIESDNPSLVGIDGVVEDETKNIITVKTRKNGEKKKLLKSQIIFTIENQKIFGKEILKSPEERIKLKIKNS
jgi:RNase P/RNase MRP subunit p29